MEDIGKSKINLLFIIDHLHGLGGGGTEKHLLYLTEKLDKKKYSCTIVAFDKGDTPIVRKIEKNGIDVIHLPVRKYYTPVAAYLAIDLIRIIRQRNIDIVQSFHVKSDIYGALVSWIGGIKIIISSKRDMGDLKKEIHFLANRLMKPLFTRYIAVSMKVRNGIVKKEHIKADLIDVIYNGVDTTVFRPPTRQEKENAKKKIGINKNDFVVGMVARFRPEKAYDIFFEGIEKISKLIHGLKVIAVGDGETCENCRRYCDSKALSPIVIFAGGVENVIPYLQAFDVACLVPFGNEGFSNSILEKMATGLPVIVTDVGGNAEAVINDYNGIVVEPHSPEAISDAILELYENRKKRIIMGMRSRERAENEFSMLKMIEKHEYLYESAFQQYNNRIKIHK